MAPEGNEDYRSLRRAFIAACDGAHLDAIARLHPVRGPDGGPLFMDSAAMGPRNGTGALLLVTGDADGSRLLTRLLQDTIALPPGARLVLVHALDPAALAGVQTDPGWPAAMLASVATEDLAKVTRLRVLATDSASLQAAARAFPDASVMILHEPALAQIHAALAAL